MLNNYYVYQHINEDGVVVYVGKGRYARAWRHEKRRKDHAEWMAEMLPLLEVKFKYINCSEQDAYKLEASLIKELQPIYNSDHTNWGDARRKGFGKWLSDNHSRFHDSNLQKDLGKRAAKSENHPNNRLEKCIHCGVEMNIGHIKRYHNDNCKWRVDTNEVN
jgi:hypothetical protein